MLPVAPGKLALNCSAMVRLSRPSPTGQMGSFCTLPWRPGVKNAPHRYWLRIVESGVAGQSASFCGPARSRAPAGLGSFCKPAGIADWLRIARRRSPLRVNWVPIVKPPPHWLRFVKQPGTENRVRFVNPAWPAREPAPGEFFQPWVCTSLRTDSKPPALFLRRGRCRWWLGPAGGQGLRSGFAFAPGAAGCFP